MPIYAKQIRPEWQESPIFFDGFWPDGIITHGNKDFTSRTSPEFDAALALDDAAYDFDFYGKKNGDGSMTILAILDFYGLERTDGKNWSGKQLGAWADLFRRMRAYHISDDDALCSAMELMTGEPWAYTEIRGSCQSDWEGVYYNASKWSSADIRHWFAVEYFNEGSEWIVHDEEDAPACPDDVSGWSVYCDDWNIEGVREEIARAAGVSSAEVVLYAWAGTHYVGEYKEA